MCHFSNEVCHLKRLETVYQLTCKSEDKGVSTNFRKLLKLLDKEIIVKVDSIHILSHPPLIHIKAKYTSCIYSLNNQDYNNVEEIDNYW